MNKKEFGLIAMAIRSYYPRDKILETPESIELWYRQLKDIPYAKMQEIITKWVSLNKWSPSIAEIREIYAEYGYAKPWSEAWEEVIKCIDRYGVYDVENAYKEMSPLTLRAVKSLGYVNICRSECINADRANFRQIYEELYKKDKEKVITQREGISGVEYGYIGINDDKQ